ncbi:MAG: response regulator transcription factor [Verrucomicrobiota bacterium]
MSPTILIADDHPIFREGLRKVIETERGGRIVAEAADGNTAVQLIRQHKPDIAVLDIVIPQLNGLGVARAVQRQGLPVSIVILTMFKEEDLFNEAMDLGAKGYVLKENTVSDIIACLQSVAAGQYFISPAISHLLLRRTDRARGFASQTPGLGQLTPSERRILGLIARGKTSKEIATELFISPKTVENHRLNIAEKLSVHGNNALLKFALEHRDKL